MLEFVETAYNAAIAIAIYLIFMFFVSSIIFWEIKLPKFHWDYVRAYILLSLIISAIHSLSTYWI